MLVLTGLGSGHGHPSQEGSASRCIMLCSRAGLIGQCAQGGCVLQKLEEGREGEMSSQGQAVGGLVALEMDSGISMITNMK